MSFSALLIGNETLTRACGAQLLARGHRIAAVVSDAPDIRAWAAAQGVAVEAPGPDLASRLPQADWLLSIANLTVLPPAVLARASKGAVNFHDGPLPRHAGLNAPVWALLAAEAEHGITWHLIEDGVDQGRILEERRFAIAEGETALTLNTRCFEAGLESFPAVLTQLENGLTPRAQSPGLRQLHRRADRPEAFGQIDFTQSSASVVRLVRALDHGRYWNPLTTAKIDTGTRVLNVGSATEALGQGAPGAVLSASAEGLEVACGSGAVRLSGLSCQSLGGAICPTTVTTRQLSALDAETRAALTAAHRAQAPQDGAQRHALATLDPLPFAATSPTQPADWQSLPLTGALPHLALAMLRVSRQVSGDIARAAQPLPGYLADWTPLTLRAEAIGPALATLTAALATKPRGWALDLLTRDPALQGLQTPPIGLSDQGFIPGTALTLAPGKLHFDATRLPEAEARALAARLDHIASQIAAATPETQLSTLSPLTEAELNEAVTRWNPTPRDHDRSLMLHTAFEAQVARTPDAPALVFEDQSLSYAALNARANRAAHRLVAMGVTPGTLVGLCARRGFDLVAGALAILKAGGAYVPMDPAYPSDRIALFAEDSACPVIVTQSDLAPQLPRNVQLLALDDDLSALPETNPQTTVQPQDLAYMIYTSGSTGRPKGVQIEHRNVVNFFTGIDDRVGTEPGTWLAVTSLSFDISVLELFWTLARGFKVVIASDETRSLVSSGPITSAQGMEFSLYYWGNDDGQGPKKYELLLEGAKFADRNGFTALWTPERHFHAFGGPYPNPSVTGAAVAAVTKNLAIRAGSCVVPLHHPARIAEEWAVIDNLTNGRSGIAIASGWHPDDFVLRPENAPPQNKSAMYAAADQVRRLWRGEGVDFPKADGSLFTVKTQPRPVSAELDIWVTTAGNPETWKEAGALGANVLTHLLGQSVEEVGQKVTLYHEALRAAGHDPARHKVTLMLHSCIGESRAAVRQLAEAPMKAYLASAAALVKQYAWAFPAFKKPQNASNPMDIDLAALSDEENAAILDFAFQRYFDDSGLFGTVEEALARVEELKRIGVAEVACLIDFGIAPEAVMQSLPALAEVVRRANQGGLAADDFSIAAQITRHSVSHLQCTPSMARMLAMNADSRSALSNLQAMLVGGEALSGGLVEDLRRAGVKKLFNMYGPTETTIWSSVEEVTETEPVTNIGLPLANQQLYVLDPQGAPVPSGAEGELWIGGEGVTRGYWQRPELTADRYRPNPFAEGRIYGTGDLVRRRADGKLDFLGRADHQVKLRGYRIELGEIEAVLEQQPGVTQAIVIAREDTPGDLRLVAYLTGHAADPALRQALKSALPEHMIPQHFVTLAAMPLTPNRKVDRKALPAPHAARAPAAQGFEAPKSSVAEDLAAIWARVLGVAKVGAKDNFFALGGHSLLAVQAHREIRESLAGAKVSITDIFRFPVLEQLAAHIEGPKAAPITTVQPQVFAATPPQPQGETLADAMERRRAMRLARRGVDV
ncbi:LLM class flavin-dependent oxidoreductase [Xinfangfangia sp. CPCC 101601]|uniref:LLM class flavin-dependent oxidoreductase n=1 Tax=Pseudogemmobacter lacusdianii TaxID=3069608 RepID=A0ABU0VZ94_9RHOB|nr:MupA/Atu3671 family FMN-dependent luciferase-like monooxygenase [Xinfangfangia sp. CPCC 101601]MDQ2066225.1 LLM class flavin-dependent oxidoreductase [Xinfangfangia sp. CPCC 101601]